MRAGRALEAAPAPSLVAAGAVSVQFGAALATHLFDRVGPTGAVTLRVVFAAVVLGAVVRPSPGLVRGLGARRADLAVLVSFGVVLGGMNLLFYEAIARIPLGVAVTVEFVGPLAVTLGGSRRRLDLVWAVLAGAGVFLLAGDGLVGGRPLDPVGVGMALGAGGCWAGYILLSAQTGRRFAGSSGLALSMVVAAVCLLPVGLATAGIDLVAPGVLGIGLVVAVLSSVLPYSFELAALRRLTPRAFGVLASLDPAFAALAGFVVLGQDLSGAELVALALVAAANAGSSALDARGRRPDRVPDAGGGEGWGSGAEGTERSVPIARRRSECAKRERA